MTLCVLCAGHRQERTGLTEPARLSFEQVLDHCERVSQTLKETGLLRQEPPVRMLVGGTDGFDTVAAASARVRGWPLHAVLDHPAQRQGDLSQAERTVLLEAPADATLAEQEFLIATRDELALAYADLLIAYWDGGAPQGVAGGTVRLLRSALVTGRALVVIFPDGSVRLSPLAQRDPSHLRALEVGDAAPVLIEQLLSPFEPAAFDKDLAALLDPAGVVAATGGKLAVDNHETQWAALKAAVNEGSMPAENGYTVRAGLLDRILVTLLAPKDRSRRTDVVKALKSSNASNYYLVDWAGARVNGEPPLHVEPPSLERAFKDWDTRANQCAGITRDLNWALHGLAAFAVFAAVAGALHLGVDHHSLFWPLAEVVAVVGILALFWVSLKRQPHGRWLSYRYSAELVRYARMSLTLLAVPQTLRRSLFSVDADGNLKPDNAEEWRLRRLLLEAGLPQTSAGLPYAPAANPAVLAQYLLNVVQDQINYHRKTSTQYHHAEHMLHKLVTACFLVTTLAVVVHIVHHASWLLLFTAALPALAGALHAIGVNREFKRLAAMSAHSKRNLEALQKAIQHAQTRIADPARLANALRSLAVDCAAEMSGAAHQWQELVEHRGLGLPA